jgi:hypothetical protein
MASNKHTFVLKGAASATTTAETEPVRSAASEPSFGTQRRPGTAHMKLLDDPRTEQMLMGRRTVTVPSFQLLTQEGEFYPEQTESQWCQWDRWPISWRPVGMPTKRYVLLGKPHFLCKRWFCSLECVLAFYCDNHAKDSELASQTLEYLDEMHRLTLAELGQPYEPLQPAADWNLIKLSGSGTMEIEEFRTLWKTRYTKEFAFVMFRGVDVYVKQHAA